MKESLKAVLVFCFLSIFGSYASAQVAPSLEESFQAYSQALENLKRETGRDNALIYYDRAADLLSNNQTMLKASKTAEQVLKGNGSAGAPDLLAAYKAAAPAFAEIKKGAAISNAELPAPKEDIHDLPNLMSYLNLARLMCAAGVYRIQKNNIPAGFDNLLAVQTMGQHLTCQNAWPIFFILGFAIESCSADAISLSLPDGKSDPVTLKLVTRHLERALASQADPVTSFYTEAIARKNFLEKVRMAKSGDAKSQQYLQTISDAPEDLKFLEMLKQNLEPVLNYYREEFDLVNAIVHLPHHLRDFDDLETKVKALNANLPASVRNDFGPEHYREFFLRLEAKNSKLQKAATEAAILAYRSEKGSLPQNLQALVPEYLSAVPVDPFSGQAISITVTGDNYQLLPPSIGLDADKRK